MYENKSYSYNQYSLGLAFSRNPRKSNTDQVYHKFFYSFWKETTPKPSKVATAKNFFSSLYVIVTTCFDKMFFISCDNWKTLFYKSLLISWGLFNCHVLALFEASDLKEVRILFLSLQWVQALLYHTSYIFRTTFKLRRSTFSL